MEPTDLLKVKRDKFMPFLERHPKLCLLMMAVLCERLRWTSDVIENTIFLDIPQRLAKRLLTFIDLYGQDRPEATKLDIHLTQDDLAKMLGATRESVNKALRSLQIHGAISYDRGCFRPQHS